MTLSRTVQLLRSAGSALLAQGGLHAELLLLEWGEERQRWRSMLLAVLAGTAFLLCSLLSLGALLVLLSWETPYRLLTLLLLLLTYSLAAGFAWYRFLALAAMGSEAFAVSRDELAADLALLKSRLSS
jgi:uncharacterized membrane protein YqjE